VPTKQMRRYLRVGTAGEVRPDAACYHLASPPRRRGQNVSQRYVHPKRTRCIQLVHARDVFLPLRQLRFGFCHNVTGNREASVGHVTLAIRPGIHLFILSDLGPGIGRASTLPLIFYF
jgi:hypothetical protein